MIVLQILLLGILLLVIPTWVGSIFAGVEKDTCKLPFSWISGQIMLWAGFQIMCVPLILMERSFTLVQQCFLIYMGVLVLLALVVRRLRRRKSSGSFRVLKGESKVNKWCYLLWGVFGVLVLLQLVLAGLLAYEEGDDAFYVAVSSITAESDTMYMILPYTGFATGLDARHGLAPFPIWISFLTRVSGIPAVTMAQIIVPIVLIVMAYAIYYLIGSRLLANSKSMLPLFMIFVAIIILFGGYSVYSAENFLLVRTAQGKAVIANIIIPFLFLLFLYMLERLQKGDKIGIGYWSLTELTMIAACLCSTLGTLLICLLLGIMGVCTVATYRKWKILIPMVLCCIMPVCYALLYLRLS